MTTPAPPRRSSAPTARRDGADSPSVSTSDGPSDGLSVGDAAKRLGLSSDAVRSRLHRGTLAGAKVNGEWRVTPTDAPAPEPVSAPAVAPPDRRPVAQTDTSSRRAVDQVERRPDIDVATLLAAEVAWLRAQIEDRDRSLEARSQELAAERERSDVLHREAFARIEALTAGAPAPSTERDPVLDAPQSDRTAPSATEAASPSPESSSGGPDGPHGSFARWWKRIFGR